MKSIAMIENMEMRAFRPGFLSGPVCKVRLRTQSKKNLSYMMVEALMPGIRKRVEKQRAVHLRDVIHVK